MFSFFSLFQQRKTKQKQYDFAIDIFLCVVVVMQLSTIITTATQPLKQNIIFQVI